VRAPAAASAMAHSELYSGAGSTQGRRSARRTGSHLFCPGKKVIVFDREGKPLTAKRASGTLGRIRKSMRKPINCNRIPRLDP
jgi:hypothetical protein